eukprot:1161993-Pelagomonas_calceolata.AAC.7
MGKPITDCEALWPALLPLSVVFVVFLRQESEKEATPKGTSSSCVHCAAVMFHKHSIQVSSKMPMQCSMFTRILVFLRGLDSHQDVLIRQGTQQRTSTATHMRQPRQPSKKEEE